MRGMLFHTKFRPMENADAEFRLPRSPQTPPPPHDLSRARRNNCHPTLFVSVLHDTTVSTMLRQTAQSVLRAFKWLVASRTRKRWLIRVLLVVLLMPILLQWALAYLLGSDSRLLPPELQHAKNLLIVTAHPDDECLFFSPSILGILDRSHHVRGGLLVMSTGTIIIITIAAAFVG